MSHLDHLGQVLLCNWYWYRLTEVGQVHRCVYLQVNSSTLNMKQHKQTWRTTPPTSFTTNTMMRQVQRFHLQDSGTDPVLRPEPEPAGSSTQLHPDSTAASLYHQGSTVTSLCHHDVRCFLFYFLILLCDSRERVWFGPGLRGVTARTAAGSDT